MDLSLDTTWCLTCSRQILPKRIQVSVASQAPALYSSPSSPKFEQEVHRTFKRITQNKTRTAAIRARNSSGIAHVPGHVKLDGIIRRPSPNTTNSTTLKAPATVTPAPSTSPIQPVLTTRQKTDIDQSPVSLYCSEECRLADMQGVQSVVIDYHPDRHSSPPFQQDSSIDSSVASESSSLFSTRPAATGPILLGYAALAAIYDLPPCPPPPPLLPTYPPAPPKSKSAHEYTSGIMMAARRIDEALGPKSEKRRPSWRTPASATYISDYKQHRKVIPGWTDGSDKWRASVYFFARPDEDVAVSRDEDDDTRCSAYRGFVSTPLRSKGVYSTLGEVKEGNEQPHSKQMAWVTSQPCQRASSEADELYAKWYMPFMRCSALRTSLSQQAHNLSMSPAASTQSPPAYPSKVSLLRKGAEGRLLIPDVKMKCANLSASFERIGVFSGQSSEANVNSQMKFIRSDSTSGSSVNGDEGHGDTNDTIHMRRIIHSPPSSGLSWYENEPFTYPLLNIPHKEKRMEKRIVDGQEVQIEVEVEVYPERKRLFLFASKEERGC